MAKTITEIVLESGAPGEFDRNGSDFDILRDAVVAADLADALNDPSASLTVFAPIDEAFVGLANTLGYEEAHEKGAFRYIVESLTLLGNGDPIPLLTEVLTYHVAAGELDAADVLSSTRIPTLQGGRLRVDDGTTPPSLIDADVGVPNPGIIATDIAAENGVIHALDGVLLPLSVSGILSQRGTDLVIGDGASTVYETRGGNDYVSAGAGNDMVLAGRGNDVVLGRNGSDVLKGQLGADTLIGNKGSDQLNGNRGRDVVDGGRDNDQLRGGAGDDTFVFSKGYDRDVVIDFRNGQDVIDVRGTDIDTFGKLDDTFVDRAFGTVLDFGNGDRLVLLGVDQSRLDESDFIFA
ncbi:fasciclin domain-containing protein [Tropicimonas isoalkanivorans]|uniref:Hemolysin-type calcium-binding repeat-containing protein n=1 Tax=Tropicimonas isoalkanivorans TaxID=441112 RepID=A0A1I1ILW2_9RHOB|nr:fasciclin domain-containing protein [Tropicimonas isoalkanivorans]SFC34230.1 Hemolysin-type calcium-binding repeat-containing protein [Tropicimonas isoalkanivorans]